MFIGEERSAYFWFLQDTSALSRVTIFELVLIFRSELIGAEPSSEMSNLSTERIFRLNRIFGFVARAD